ncbi:MAG: hypothetical protein Q4G67_11065 [Actinomycetia bacterium]|nr:hypothetical protein [Actinomycetes bacterium]
MTASPPVRTLVRADSSIGEVALRARGSVTELVVNGTFVMDTVDVSTEIALAACTLDRHAAPHRVLVGGLGLGFTAREVLTDSRVEQLTVIEIAAPLVAWAQEGLLPTDLQDARLRLLVGDVADVVGSSEGEWDLILLDVDNGPGFLVRAENAELYAAGGVGRLLAALAPGGVLAIWSSHRDAALLATLAAATPEPIEEMVLPVQREGRSFDYAIYLARIGDRVLTERRP